MDPNERVTFQEFLKQFKDFMASNPTTIRALEDSRATYRQHRLSIKNSVKQWLDELLKDSSTLDTDPQPLELSKFPLSLSKELRTFKICLIGDYAVGKTTLRRKYMGQSLAPNYLPTLGADFSHYRTMYQGYPVELLIWDLAGQPRFQTVRGAYFTGSYGAVVVFDVTRPATFFNAFFWIDEFVKHMKSVKPLVLLGNKIDLINAQQQEVDLSYYDRFCMFFQQKMLEQYNVLIGYAKTSAITGENVKEGFEQLLHGILRWIELTYST